MIARHNLTQIALTVWSLAVSLFGYVCAYFFFRFIVSTTFSWFDRHPSEMVVSGLTGVVLILITLSGIRQWRRGVEPHSYADSALYHDLGADTGGAVMTDFYAHRVTGPAYLLSRIFLAGPRHALSAWCHWHNRIAPEAGLDTRLADVLERVRILGKWQTPADHPGCERELRLLARMKRMDVSYIKGGMSFRVY
jgi:hypothetical protein